MIEKNEHEQGLLSRRSFMKGALAVAALVPTGALLSACASPQDGAASSSASSMAEESSSSSVAEPSSSSTAEEAEGTATAAGPVLVAYYSATGNTRAVAEAIAAHLDADVFEITPVDPYTEEDLGYTSDDSRASRERDDPNRSVELVQTSPEGFDSYRTVFVGYPIWWDEAAWVVDGFATGNEFTGKTVIPFCTSGSSPIGTSGQNLAALAGTGEWLEGARFPESAAASEVEAWVDGLEL